MCPVLYVVQVKILCDATLAYMYMYITHVLYASWVGKIPNGLTSIFPTSGFSSQLNRYIV